MLSIFSACTIGGEESQGVVTIESTTETTIVDEEITFEEGVLDFAQCMREEGINFPDPTFDIDGNPQFDNLEIENEEEFESAFENCEDILGIKVLTFPIQNLASLVSLPLEMQILILLPKLCKMLLKFANLKTH